MSQPDDNLHDWIRQSLATYRPDYNPADWQRMQRRLRRRRWLRPVGLGLGSLILLVALLKGLLSNSDHIARPVNQPAARRSPVGTSPTGTPRVVPPVVRSEVAEKQAKITSRPTAPRPRLVRTHPVVFTPAPLQLLRTMTPQPTRRFTLAERASRVLISREEATIIRQLQTGQFGPDSTSYRALARNLAHWPDAVIVCDLTSSMYPYTTQLLTWLRNQAVQPNWLGMVFFTDCDSLGRQTRPGGPPGQMFLTRSRDVTAILPTLLLAARNTILNDDDAENDVEALLFAQRAFPRARNLILVADNLSRIKDMTLLPELTRPVHVVLCGTTGGDTTLAFQPEFGQIARQTSGSLHTLEDDLVPLAVEPTKTLRVGTHYYRYNQKRRQFILTPFHHRPRRYLGFIWL